MTLKQRIAVTLPAGPKVQDTMDLLRWAEEAGYDDGWFSDGGAPDNLTMMAAAAGATQKLRLGIAVVPVYTRTPAVLAATANTLGQLLPGRFVLGLGSSSETMMTGWHGVDFEQPLTRVKETTIMVRAMLRGEKTNFDLKTLHSHGYRQSPLETPVPIFLAALRPKMIEMAAEIGDGVIFNLWPRRALPRMIEHLDAGAARAGKAAGSVELVNRHHVFVTGDKARGRALFRAAFAPYYATGVYNRFLEWSGYADEAAIIREGWAAKDRAKTAAGLPDSLVDEIGIIGSADECRERIAWCAKSGLHTHIIAPLPGATPEEKRATYDAFRSR